MDESEAFIGREPEGDDDEEETIERRLHACEVIPVKKMVHGYLFVKIVFLFLLLFQ